MEQNSERDHKKMWELRKEESKRFKHTRAKCALGLHLLLGDVSLNKLLQNPTVVDVSATTGAQRPISLSATKRKSRVKVAIFYFTYLTS